MARKPDGPITEPNPRARARRQIAAPATSAAPGTPDRRRPPRPARPRLNLSHTLADAAPVAPAAPLESLLAPKDVARFLNTSTKTVRRLVLDGHLRQLRIAGKATPRFRRRDVEALVTVDPSSRTRKPRGGNNSSGGSPSGGSTPPAP